MHFRTTKRATVMNVEQGHLTTLNLLTTATAPAGSKAILESAQSQMGRVPNLYATMAHSPGLINTYRLGYDDFRRDSGFTKVEQEVVFLAVSRFHECTYCVAVHRGSKSGTQRSYGSSTAGTTNTGSKVGSAK
jgi:alkylhydroperoxidase family enzyme